MPVASAAAGGRALEAGAQLYKSPATTGKERRTDSCKGNKKATERPVELLGGSSVASIEVRGLGAKYCSSRNKSLADLLHGFVQRWPFLFESFVFDLPQLGIRNLEALGHDLVRTSNTSAQVLGSNQVPEDVATLL